LNFAPLVAKAKFNQTRKGVRRKSKKCKKLQKKCSGLQNSAKNCRKNTHLCITFALPPAHLIENYSLTFPAKSQSNIGGIDEFITWEIKGCKFRLFALYLSYYFERVNR
jgi:hypothetical protein